MSALQLLACFLLASLAGASSAGAVCGARTILAVSRLTPCGGRVVNSEPRRVLRSNVRIPMPSARAVWARTRLSSMARLPTPVVIASFTGSRGGIWAGAAANPVAAVARQAERQASWRRSHAGVRGKRWRSEETAPGAAIRSRARSAFERPWRLRRSPAADFPCRPTSCWS